MKKNIFFSSVILIFLVSQLRLRIQKLNKGAQVAMKGMGNQFSDLSWIRSNQSKFFSTSDSNALKVVLGNLFQ
jgi:hypothetical protein